MWGSTIWDRPRTPSALQRALVFAEICFLITRQVRSVCLRGQPVVIYFLFVVFLFHFPPELFLIFFFL